MHRFMSLVNLVVPAAGLGSRFVEEGFDLPKPMIQFRSVSLLQRSVSSVIKNFEINQLLIILNQEHVTKHRIDQFVSDLFPSATQLVLPKLSKGPAETAYFGIKELIEQDLPVVINDCDHEFGQIMGVDNLEALDWHVRLSWFDSSNPRFSYAKIQENRVVRIAEKEKISNNAIAGCYIFKSPRHFLHPYSAMLNKHSVEAEQYISKVVQQTIDDGGSVLADKMSYHRDLGIPGALSDVSD